MKIEIDLDITGNEELLCEQFGFSYDENNLKLLEESLQKILKTSSKEYLEMILGNKTFSRINDLKEFRLLLLIENYFNGKIPSEVEVASIFQIRTTEAKSLLKSIESKYRIRLKTAMKKTLCELINNIHKEDGKQIFNFRCASPFYIDQLNDLLSKNDIEHEGNVDLIKKIDSKTSQYEITESSLSILKNVLHQPENQNEAR